MHLVPDGVPARANQLAEGFSNATPPSEPPDQEDIQAIADAVANVDPAQPFTVLELALTVCNRSGMQDYCQAALFGALGAPVPLSSTTLDGEGSCFSGSQSGTGFAFGPGRFWNLEWTADYEAGGHAVGVISGTASDFQGNQREVSGLIGPGCGAGGKALVLVYQ